MLKSRSCLSVFSDYCRIAKYFNRFESEICDSDRNKDRPETKSKNSEDTTCKTCRSNPCECNLSAPTMYDRKYGHNLPCDNVTPQFETLPRLPTGIFRSTTGEILGRGAEKGSFYQNPEYFSYHHMSFYDMHIAFKKLS